MHIYKSNAFNENLFDSHNKQQYKKFDFKSKGAIQRRIYIQRVWRKFSLVRNFAAEYIQKTYRGYAERKILIKILSEIIIQVFYWKNKKLAYKTQTNENKSLFKNINIISSKGKKKITHKKFTTIKPPMRKIKIDKQSSIIISKVIRVNVVNKISSTLCNEFIPSAKREDKLKQSKSEIISNLLK